MRKGEMAHWPHSRRGRVVSPSTLSATSAILVAMTAVIEGDALPVVNPAQEPDHLRNYHQLDAQLLPLVMSMKPVTFDQLSVAVEDPRVRAALPHWLASAQWRGLVARGTARGRSPRIYVSGPAAQAHIASAA